ncbi:MAG: hypothetical protein ACP5G7_03820, partial [Anaerolineae bacterium]
PEQGEVWGKILFFSGLFAVVVGFVLWLLGSGLAMSESEPVDAVSSILAGGMCCFGPPALLGAFLCILGVILWTSYRQRP